MSTLLRLIGRASFVSPLTYGRKVKKDQTIRVSDDVAPRLLALTNAGNPVFTTSGVGSPSFDFQNKSPQDGMIAGVVYKAPQKKIFIPGIEAPLPVGEASPETALLDDLTFRLKKNGKTYGNLYFVSNFTEFKAALAYLENAAYPGAIYTPPYMNVTEPFSVNMARVSIIGNNSVFDCSTLGAVEAMTFDFRVAATSGALIRTAKVGEYRGFRLAGPGKTVIGSKGVYVNTTTIGKSPRPKLDNVMVHGFHGGVTGKDSFFCMELHGVEIYGNAIGYWQLPGADSGENCSMFGGVMHHNDLNIFLEDSSSALNIHSASVNYAPQQAILRSGCKLSFLACHVEHRGGGGGSDPVHIIDGIPANNPSVPVAGIYDWMYLEGDTTQVNWIGGLFDINQSGGIGPYDWLHLINVKDPGCRVYISEVSATNTRNWADRLWTGQGRVFGGFKFRSSTNPSVCARATDRQLFNNARDMNMMTGANNQGFAASALGVQHSAWISQDTNNTIPSNRYTGTNGTLSLNWMEDSANTAAFTASAANSTTLSVTAKSAGTIIPGMRLLTGAAVAGTYIAEQLTSTESGGALGGTGTYRMTISQNIAGGTSMTAAQPVGGTTFNGYIVGEILTVTSAPSNSGKIVRGMILHAAGMADGVQISGPLGNFNGGVGTYLITVKQGTPIGSSASPVAMACVVPKAITFGKLTNTTASPGGRTRHTWVTPLHSRGPASVKVLAMNPTSGGIGGSAADAFLSLAYVCIQGTDANGLPQIVDRSPAFASVAISRTAANQWTDYTLGPWGVDSEPPEGFTHVELLLNMDAVSVIGGIKMAMRHDTVWASSN